FMKALSFATLVLALMSSHVASINMTIRFMRISPLWLTPAKSTSAHPAAPHHPHNTSAREWDPVHRPKTRWAGRTADRHMRKCKELPRRVSARPAANSLHFHHNTLGGCARKW